MEFALLCSGKNAFSSETFAFFETTKSFSSARNDTHTNDTSQMADYSLNELTDMHLLYPHTEDAYP